MLFTLFSLNICYNFFSVQSFTKTFVIYALSSTLEMLDDCHKKFAPDIQLDRWRVGHFCHKIYSHLEVLNIRGALTLFTSQSSAMSTKSLSTYSCKQLIPSLFHADGPHGALPANYRNFGHRDKRFCPVDDG